MQSAVLSRSPSQRRGSSRRPSGPSSRRESIDPARLVRMDKVEHVGGSDNFNVVFIGAGNIMFGSDEGPWNHSFRFEHKLGPRLKVIALIDPVVDRAQFVLAKKCDSFVVSAYKDTRVFKSFEDFLKDRAELPRRVHAFVIGSPPMFRGNTKSGADVEIQILKNFPGVALFIEKPVATGPFEGIQDAFTVAQLIRNSGTTCSVGYMLRYLKAVQLIKKTIEDNNLTVMGTIARYSTAYPAIKKLDWWDKSKSCGPIIEQGTHLCDLSRYFGGDVDLSTVMAHALEWDEPAGYLSALSVDESNIDPENRVPRVTSAVWKYENGGIGTLTHALVLHGMNYSCELEVLCDGYAFKLQDPYVLPVLYIRRPGNDTEDVHRFPDDDPFFSEVSNLIDVIEDIEEGDGKGLILSSFEDACKTYEFTWVIRRASEAGVKKKVQTAVPSGAKVESAMEGIEAGAVEEAAPSVGVVMGGGIAGDAATVAMGVTAGEVTNLSE